MQKLHNLLPTPNRLPINESGSNKKLISAAVLGVSAVALTALSYGIYQLFRPSSDCYLFESLDPKQAKDFALNCLKRRDCTLGPREIIQAFAPNMGLTDVQKNEIFSLFKRLCGNGKSCKTDQIVYDYLKENRGIEHFLPCLKNERCDLDQKKILIELLVQARFEEARTFVQECFKNPRHNLLEKHRVVELFDKFSQTDAFELASENPGDAESIEQISGDRTLDALLDPYRIKKSIQNAHDYAVACSQNSNCSINENEAFQKINELNSRTGLSFALKSLNNPESKLDPINVIKNINKDDLPEYLENWMKLGNTTDLATAFLIALKRNDLVSEVFFKFDISKDIQAAIVEKLIESNMAYFLLEPFAFAALGSQFDKLDHLQILKNLPRDKVDKYLFKCMELGRPLDLVEAYSHANSLSIDNLAPRFFKVETSEEVQSKILKRLDWLSSSKEAFALAALESKFGKLDPNMVLEENFNFMFYTDYLNKCMQLNKRPSDMTKAYLTVYEKGKKTKVSRVFFDHHYENIKEDSLKIVNALVEQGKTSAEHLFRNAAAFYGINLN